MYLLCYKAEGNTARGGHNTNNEQCIARPAEYIASSPHHHIARAKRRQGWIQNFMMPQLRTDQRRLRTRGRGQPCSRGRSESATMSTAGSRCWPPPAPTAHAKGQTKPHREINMKREKKKKKVRGKKRKKRKKKQKGNEQQISV